MEFLTSNFISLLVGITGSLIATFLSGKYKKNILKKVEIENALKSDDVSERGTARKLCFAQAAQYYLIANMIWVIAGASWVFDILGGNYGVLYTRVLLAISSIISLWLFYQALVWVTKGLTSK